jgi:uncharacterized protein YidB (DUF937 family)
MSKGYPSMTALLGLLAVAGFQNRDKIAEWLGHHSTEPQRQVPPAVRDSHAPSNLSSILGGVGSAGVGGLIASGLSELVDHFTKSGHGEAANSWVNHGPNRDIPEAELERVIGPETLDHLTRQTGLSRAALLSRLSRELPSAIDRYSPDGRLPV